MNSEPVPSATAASAGRVPAALAAAGVAAVVAALWAVPAAAAAVFLFACAALAVFRRPERWLGIMTWLLPFHAFAMVALFGVLRLPAGIVRVVAAWKEASVLGVLVMALVGVAAGRRRAPRPHWADLCAATLVALAVAFIASTNLWVSRPRPIAMQLYGFRDTTFFIALYAIGRLTPAVASSDRPLARLYAVGVITSVLAVLERMFVTPDMLILLGVSRYFSDFLGLSEFIADESGLPGAYFTSVGGKAMARAGSVYLSGQGFAVPFLVVMPAATVWLLSRRRTLTAYAGYMLLWVGLVLTITRATMAACLLQLFVLLFLYRRTTTAAVIVASATAAVVAASLAVPRLGLFVWQTLTWQTPSSGSHAKDYARALSAMLANPLGHGLGTADATALRFDFEPITFDNQYFKFGVELGVLGMLAYILLLVAAASAALHAFRRGATPSVRGFAAAAFAMVLGAAVNDLTGTLFNAPMFGYVFSWFIGAAVTLSATAAEGTPEEHG